MRFVTLFQDLAVAAHETRVSGAFELEDDVEAFPPYSRLAVPGPSGRFQLFELTPGDIADRLAARWSDVRAERNARLADCDWTQLADSPLTTEQRAAWATYRQALRDLTAQPDPFDLTWPEAP